MPLANYEILQTIILQNETPENYFNNVKLLHFELGGKRHV